MIPTQSALRAYDTAHLSEHAAHWRDLAARRRSVVGAINAGANSLDWAGAGDAGMKAAMASHLSTAQDEAGLLDSAADTAEGGASMLGQQQQSILSGVDQAGQSGFAVGEDWSVTDTAYTPGSMGWMARQPTAQAISADLRTQAGAFAGQESQTATDVTTAAGDLGGQGAVRGHIQAVGNGFKTDGPTPTPAPPPGPPQTGEPIKLPPPTTMNIAPPISMDPPQAPPHKCGPGDVAKYVTETLGGGVGIGAALAGEIPTLGLATSGVLAGLYGVWDGFENLDHCK